MDGSYATWSRGYLTCNFLLALATWPGLDILKAVLRQKLKVVLYPRFCCRTCPSLHVQHPGFSVPATLQRSVVLPVWVWKYQTCSCGFTNYLIIYASVQVHKIFGKLSDRIFWPKFLDIFCSVQAPYGKFKLITANSNYPQQIQNYGGKFKFTATNSNSTYQLQFHHINFNANSPRQFQIHHDKFKFSTKNSNSP